MKSSGDYAKKVWKNPAYFIAFGFGSGLSLLAPGTAGTVAAIPLYYIISGCAPLTYLGIVLLALIVGIWITDYVSKDMHIHDFNGIVWDEIVGFFITMFLIPCSLNTILLGFIFFRIFDVWKPWPIRVIDKSVQGGFGIMLDDVLAAIAANVSLQALIYSGFVQASMRGLFV